MDVGIVAPVVGVALAVVVVDRAVRGQHGLDVELSDLSQRGEKIAERIFHALTAASPKVRYQITSDPMRHLITAILPKRMVDRIIAKRLGLLPSA